MMFVKTEVRKMFGTEDRYGLGLFVEGALEGFSTLCEEYSLDRD